MNGRKASRPKDVKRLLGARSKSGKGRSTHTIETVHAPPKVEWVNDSKSNPPVKALVSVVRSDGTIQEKVEVRDNTNVGELLKVVRRSLSCLPLTLSLRSVQLREKSSMR